MADAQGMVEGPEEAGPWYEWGPYLSERAWGSVREDYSDNGDAWSSFPYEHALSRSYRWSEDGLAGISDIWQDLCFGLAFWNGRDSHLKERLYGLSGHQGNHGEDVKEYYWYRDATPSHSWLRWRYRYPQAAFPYEDLIETNAQRDRSQPEYELMDTGVFDEDRYWNIDVDYAKADPTDIYIRIRITNAGPEADTIHVLPQLWFRDTWSWGRRHRRPEVRHVSRPNGSGTIVAEHWRAGLYHLDAASGPNGHPTALFCENASNNPALWGDAAQATTPFPKDGINDHVLHNLASVNPSLEGTKAAWWYEMSVAPGETVELRLRLWSPTEGDVADPAWPTTPFEDLMAEREAEADEFYAAIAPAERSSHHASGLRRNDLDEAVLPLRREALARRRPARATTAAWSQTHPKPELAPLRRLRRLEHARCLGVPLVRRLGPRVPHGGVRPRRPGVRQVPTRRHVARVVHAPERRDSGV